MQRSVVVVVVVLVALLGVAPCESTITITGHEGLGKETLSGLAAFRSFVPTSPVAFIGVENVSVVVEEVAAGRAAAGFLTDVQKADLDAGLDGVSLSPFAQDSLVPLVRFPGTAGSLLLGSSVSFSAELLVRIAGGNVTRWDDPRLFALNPGPEYSSAVAALPDTTIELHALPAHTATSVAMVHLWEMLGDSSFPAVSPGSTTYHSSGLEAAGAVYDAATLGAFAVVPSSSVRVISVPTPVNLLSSFHSEDGGPRVPYSDAVLDMVDTRRVSLTSPESMVFGDPNVWPLVIVDWVVLPTGQGSGVECEQYDVVMGDLYLMLSDRDVEDILAQSLGYAPVSGSASASLTTVVTEFTCGGTRRLGPNIRTVFGAGASFPQSLYAAWMLAYRKQVLGTDPIRYSAVGSGSGKRAMVADSVTFAGSDSPLSDSQLDARPDLIMIPVAIGAVVTPVSVSLLPGAPRDTPLVLGRDVLVGIFAGQITMWNDTRISSLNPVLAPYLPPAYITRIVRLDSSGTTSIFTSALSSMDPTWDALVSGSASLPDWPGDRIIHADGNSGIGSSLLATPNAIGYVVWDTALSFGLSIPSLVNARGDVVSISETSLGAVAAEANVRDPVSSRLPFVKSLSDPSISGAWPIAGFTYFVYPSRSAPECEPLRRALEYLKWTLTSSAAPSLATGVGFAAVRDPGVVESLMDTIDDTTCDGDPLFRVCADGFSFDSETASCVLCPNGTFSNAATLSVCTPCPLGTVAPRGSGSCSLCPIHTYADQSALSQAVCLPCPDRSGTLNVGASSVADCICDPGTWRGHLHSVAAASILGNDSVAISSVSEGRCWSCPPHSTCPGGDAPPIAGPGYWARPGLPEAIFKCRPLHACIGNSVCRPGHTGERCSLCLQGYFTEDSVCTKCPEGTSIKLAILFAIIVLILIIPILLPQHKIMMAQVAPVATTFGQILAALATLRVGWPSSISFAMRMLSPVQWISTIAPPQCSLVDSWYVSWILRTLLPLFCTALTVVALILTFALKGVLLLVLSYSSRRVEARESSSSSGGALNARSRALLRILSTNSLARSFSVLTTASVVTFFVFFSQAPLEFFNCFEASDGKHYLVADPSEQCFTGDWMRFLPLAIFAFSTHIVGVLAITWFALVKARHQETRDSPRFQTFVGFLYLRYQPRTFFWEVVQFARKLSTFTIAQFLFDAPILAATLIILVQLVYTVAHLSYMPFLMPGTNTIDTALSIILVTIPALGIHFSDELRDDGAIHRDVLTISILGILGITYVSLLWFSLVESLASVPWVSRNLYGALSRSWPKLRSPTVHTRVVLHKHPNPKIHSRIVHVRELDANINTFLEIRNPEKYSSELATVLETSLDMVEIRASLSHAAVDTRDPDPDTDANVSVDERSFSDHAAVTNKLLSAPSQILGTLDSHGSLPVFGTNSQSRFSYDNVLMASGGIGLRSRRGSIGNESLSEHVSPPLPPDASLARRSPRLREPGARQGRLFGPPLDSPWLRVSLGGRSAREGEAPLGVQAEPRPAPPGPVPVLAALAGQQRPLTPEASEVAHIPLETWRMNILYVRAGGLEHGGLRCGA